MTARRRIIRPVPHMHRAVLRHAAEYIARRGWTAQPDSWGWLPADRRPLTLGQALCLAATTLPAAHPNGAGWYAAAHRALAEYLGCPVDAWEQGAGIATADVVAALWCCADRIASPRDGAR